MTAPSPTARVTPSGRKMGDGKVTTVTLSADTNCEFFEKSVTPPGLEGDAPNDTSNMHNSAYRTFSPRSLMTMTPVSVGCQWDPILYSSMASLINVPQTITVTFPDHSTLAFYGYVKSFKPGAQEEGKVPEATIEIQPTNQDPITCVEEAPVYTAGSGTASSC